MKKQYHPFLGINEIEKHPVKIKNSEIKIFSLSKDCNNKTLKKKLDEIEWFKKVGIFPSCVSINQKYVRSSFTDRHGKIHERYLAGILCPCNGYEHYIKTTGKGCGVPISKTNTQEESFDRIELISGICLYGDKKFLLKTRSGNIVPLTELDFQLDEPVDDVFVDESYSVYEVEALVGLSSFVNILAKWNDNVKTVHMEIPRGQYYLFLADAYEKGYLSAELFQRCINEIDKRHEKIFRAYKKRLHIRNINKVNPLKAVEKYFNDILKKKGGICILKAQEILSQDETWRETWRMLLSVSPPEAWKDLSYLAHIAVFLKFGKKEPNKAVLQVDDPSEEVIQIKVSKIIRKIGEKEKYRVWGVYPLQKVFLNSEYYSDSYLYYCPDIKLNISMMRKIISQSRYGCPPEKTDPFLT